MTKQRSNWLIFFLLISLLLPALFLLSDAAADENGFSDMVATGIGQRYTETIPVIDIRNFGYQPMSVTSDPINNSQLIRGGGSDPHNPYAVIRKTAPKFLHPGATVHY